MRLFRIYVDGTLFYHPQLSRLAVTEAKVQEDAENIDSFTLSAPYNHPYLDSIHPMSSVIVCKKGNETVFEGRALDDGSDFYNTHTWTCESALSYLKDSLQPPYEYKGSLRGLLEYFVAEHNKNVEEKKQFTVGEVTVVDTNDYISYSCSDYSVTMDAIREKLIKTHGGYLRLRYTSSGKVLDYLADFTEASLQKVEYGKNLTDVKINHDHTERVTALIPLGAKIKTTDAEGNEVETDERVTIEAANDGKNYVFDEDTVKEIGWIWATEVWEDVTLSSNLLRKAKVRISELAKGITSMELTIVDESDTGADIADIHARQKEVDALLGTISETVPSVPSAGDFWYKIDHTAKTVTLMKYSGTAWEAATEKQSLTYTWYKQDKDGKEAAFDKTGKVIYLSAEDIDSIATLQCDVSN